MLATIVHRIDPVITQVGGVCLWWYGFSYTVGFLILYLWLRRLRHHLPFSSSQIDTLMLTLLAGALLGGRLVEVMFYEWPFYRQHLRLIPALWIGGMSTHGLLWGAIISCWWFCRRHRVPALTMLDELAVPGAIIMGLGRIGNFIDGQIVGTTTHLWWAVQFPDADGLRHPVVLYDGLKNLMLVPLLLWIRRACPPAGVVAAVFLIGYSSLRVVVDLFREYPTTLLGVATGQGLNVLMASLGMALLVRSLLLSRRSTPPAPTASDVDSPRWMRVALAGLLAFSLIIPSDWTQDVPGRYGKRHPKLKLSAFYPKLDKPSR